MNSTPVSPPLAAPGSSTCATASDAPPAPAGLRAAAILDEGVGDTDALLAAIASEQQRAGRRVRGLVMTRPGGGRDCASTMVLVDVHTADAYLVSQPMGSGSTACRADPQGFARASRVLHAALAEAPDLVISNRFGGLEAEGAGFRHDLIALMERDIPLLTVVAARHLDAWQRFSGGTELLPADAARVHDWIERTLATTAAPATTTAPVPAGAPPA